MVQYKHYYDYGLVNTGISEPGVRYRRYSQQESPSSLLVTVLGATAIGNKDDTVWLKYNDDTVDTVNYDFKKAGNGVATGETANQAMSRFAYLSLLNTEPTSPDDTIGRIVIEYKYGTNIDRVVLGLSSVVKVYTFRFIADDGTAYESATVTVYVPWND